MVSRVAPGRPDIAAALPPIPDLADKRATALQGSDFAWHFLRLLKGCRQYEHANSVVKHLLDECMQVIARHLVNREELTFRVTSEQYYYNNRRVTVNPKDYQCFHLLAQELERRQIGYVEFCQGIAPAQLLEFCYLFWSQEEQNESNALSMMKTLEGRGISTIHVGRYEQTPEHSESVDLSNESLREKSKMIYSQTMKAVREVLSGMKNNHSLNLRKAKHMIQHAVDTAINDEAVLLGLTAIRDFDEYTFGHSVSVAFLAIALGHRLGLPKAQLSNLGLAALFHDIGKIDIPHEILNKPAKLTPEEWEVIRKHPTMGAVAVLKRKAWGPLAACMLMSTFEHHMKYDRSGYPSLDEEYHISLFGRIMTLVDCYDAMGRARAYRKLPYASEQITGYMLERAGRDFDPILVKAFINMIGVYPLGTMVQLDTGEKGIVMHLPQETEFVDRPRVCVVQFEGGIARKGGIVDLSEMDPATGQFKHSIVRTLDPNEYHLNILDFLL